jgi:RimJ/RimL family protein N-acetyltransferase
VATEHYGISSFRAAVRHGNIASRRVLEKVGFVVVGPTLVAGQPGTLYEFLT